MRHRVKGRKLSRTTPHRKATLRALSSALIKEHRIETTAPKAKELRTFIEPLITIAKEDTTHNRRKVFSKLQDKYAVTELFETVGPAAADRPGGYTRVLKLGFRLGDSAELAVIELVDFNDVQPEEKSAKKKRTRRAGKSNKPDTEETPVPKTEAEKSDDSKPEKIAPEAKKAEPSTDVEENSAQEQAEEKTAKAEEDTTPEAADATAEDKKKGTSEEGKSEK